MLRLVSHLSKPSLFAVGTWTGCWSNPPKSPDDSDSIRRFLDQSGYKDVTVSQDRDKGVVTVGGHVPSDTDKSQAESIAKSIAGSQVAADDITVVPPGDGGSDGKSANSDLDDGVGKSLDAALIPEPTEQERAIRCQEWCRDLER
jgi:hypothetical protein